MNNVIETHGLTRTFKGLAAVKDLGLTVTTGEVFAYLGRNGAGKTTTIKLLSGLLSPTRGRSLVLGRDSRNLDSSAWNEMGYVSENQELYEWMTGDELISFTSGLHDSWDSEFERTLRKKLSLKADARIAQCSRGEKAKIALLLAMAYRPRLLILDEPFLGLDALAREELLGSLLEITDQNEWSVFFSTQDIDEVERLADHVGIIDGGRLQLTESLDSLQRRFRQVHLTLAEPLSTTFSAEWALHVEQSEQVLRCVHTRFSPETEAQLAGDFPSARVEVETMSLREIFVALARQFQKGAE